MKEFIVASIGGAFGAALMLLFVVFSGIQFPGRARRWTAISLAICLPGIAGASYFLASPAPAHEPALPFASLAAPPALVAMTAPAGSPTAGASPRQVPPVASLVDNLERRLRQAPGDGSGWLLLARSYEHLGRTEDARAAYRQAVVFGAKDSELAERLRTGAADVATDAPKISDEPRTAADSGS